MAGPARLALAALLLASARPAAGDEPEEQGYFGQLRAGAFFPLQSTGDAQGRFSGELAGGLLLGRHLAVELGLGLFRSHETISRAPIADPRGTPVSVGADHDVLALTGNARLLQPFGRWEASLLAGGGGYRVEEGIAPSAPVAAVNPRIQLGAQLGAGLLFRPRPEVTVGVEARWFTTFPSWTGASGRVDGVAVLAGVGFRS